VALYNLAGSIFLFRDGEFFYFTYPEPQIYGGIGMVVATMCIILIVGFANNSYMWTRVLFFLWPAVLIIAAIRGAFMIFRLDYYQTDIIWECNHGGQLWTSAAANATATINTTANAASNTMSTDGTIPSSFCSSGFHSVYLAFTFALLVDYGLQLYLYFMTWRFKARIEYYALLASKENGLYFA